MVLYIVAYKVQYLQLSISLGCKLITYILIPKFN